MSIREQDLVDNPTPRVPICLVLDRSGSMSGDPIDELNNGVKHFFESIMSDEIASHSAEISVVTFGDRVKNDLDFTDVNKQEVPNLSACGGTPMGEAVNLALDLLEKRKNEYSQAGVDYYQPWLVLMTDGEPTDDISSAASRTSELINKRKLTIFPIAIGDSSNISTLKSFSPTRTPLRLKGLNFKEFFEWLSKSVSRVSQSTPGEKVVLDVKGISTWGEV